MEKKKLTRFIIIFAVIFVALIVGIILTGMTKSGGHEEIGVVMKDSVLHERYKINLFGLIEVNPAVISFCHYCPDLCDPEIQGDPG